MRLADSGDACCFVALITRGRSSVCSTSPSLDPSRTTTRFLASLGDNPEAWWKLPDVQDARRNLVHHYANFSPDWKQQWEREFESVLDTAR
jgi:hypothetical protein